MWSREEAENWFFNILELIEIIIYEYFRIFFGILFHPQKTLTNTLKKERVSPFIFFFINLLFVGIIDSFANEVEFVKIILKSLVLTAKPTFDDAFFSIFGLGF